MGSASGIEVRNHRAELEPILRQIMHEHTARKGCEWRPMAIEDILCDLEKSFERQEICKIAA